MTKSSKASTFKFHGAYTGRLDSSKPNESAKPRTDHKPMMACGHTAQGTVGALRQPCCVICYGINALATVIADSPDLSGRKAQCQYCGTTVESDLGLPFFKYQGTQDTDKYCCSNCLIVD